MFNKQKNILLSETICQIAFAIGSSHFQLTTSCSQLRMGFFQAVFQHTPIFSWIHTVSQNSNNIGNRKQLLIGGIIPNRPDFPVIEKTN